MFQGNEVFFLYHRINYKKTATMSTRKTFSSLFQSDIFDLKDKFLLSWTKKWNEKRVQVTENKCL